MGAKLAGHGSIEARATTFRTHWRAICGDVTTEPQPRLTHPTAATTATTSTSTSATTTCASTTPTTTPSTTTSKARRAELAAAHFPDHITVDADTFLNVVKGLPSGKAGGGDGVLSDFFVTVHESHMCDLHRMAEQRLRGCGKAPALWGKAIVTLIPKIASPVAAGDFRPITALPTIQKVVLRT